MNSGLALRSSFFQRLSKAFVRAPSFTLLPFSSAAPPLVLFLLLSVQAHLKTVRVSIAERARRSLENRAPEGGEDGRCNLRLVGRRRCRRRLVVVVVAGSSSHAAAAVAKREKAASHSLYSLSLLLLPLPSTTLQPTMAERFNILVSEKLVGPGE